MLRKKEIIMTIDTRKNLDFPINRLQLEEITIKTLQNNCSNKIVNQLYEDQNSYNGVSSNSFGFIPDKLGLKLIRHHNIDSEIREENPYIYEFSLSPISPPRKELSKTELKLFIDDIFTDYVENLPLNHLLELCRHSYACPSIVINEFTFDLFLTKVIFTYDSNFINYGDYDNIVLKTVRSNIDEFVTYTAAHIDYYLPLWQKKPILIENIIEILIEAYTNKKQAQTAEFHLLWLKLLEQATYVADKSIITEGLLFFKQVPSTVDFSMFYKFLQALMDKEKVKTIEVKDKFPITFKVTSSDSITEFIEDFLNNPAYTEKALTIVKKLRAQSEISFDINNHNDDLNTLLKQTDIKNIQVIAKANQVLKAIFQ